MEENLNKNVPEQEEGIDFMALAKKVWEGRKTVLKCLAVFVVLGLVSAFTMTRVYSVSTVMVPQMNSSRSSSLSSLASLAGFDLGTSNMSGSELSPLVYPQIVSSIPFQLELLHTPLHYAKADTAVSMITYYKDYNKPNVFSYIKKYTIGLPGTIMGLFSKEKPQTTLPGAGVAADNDKPKPIVLTKAEEKMLPVIASSVSLTVDKKEGYLVLSVKGTEPIQTAELALKAQQLLQEEVTRFRTQKAQDQLDYVQARYDEIKKEAESYQTQLAAITDRSQEMLTTRSRIEKDRIQSKYSIASTIYAEMAKQLEQAKMQVKKDTPTITVIKPVTVPTQPANSRAKTLFGWTFFGLVVGCGIVLGKDYYKKFKEKFKEAKEA